MKKLSFSVVTLTALGGGLLWWRFAVRRLQLPCPPWMTWFLENPYMHAVASADSLLERAGVLPGMRLLDVGCGPGRVTIPAAERVGPEGEVVALDVQQAMLDEVTERARRREFSNVRTVLAGADEETLPSSQFDRAIIAMALGEIPDRVAALRSVYEALRPGGVLSVTEVLPDPHYQREATVRELARDAGFEFAARHGGGLAYTLNFAKPYPA